MCRNACLQLGRPASRAYAVRRCRSTLVGGLTYNGLSAEGLDLGNCRSESNR